MKKKFETNVAIEIPKTKLHEPPLPWKLSEDEVGQIGSIDSDYRAAISGTPPLRTRGIFLILLVVTIFGITTYMISNAVIENERIRSSMIKKDGELSLMHLNLEKTAADRDAVNKNMAQLEKKLNDLTAQKQLFASVIESLTKKGEEAEILTPSQAVQTNIAAVSPQTGQ